MKTTFSTSAWRNSALRNLTIIIALTLTMLSCTDRDNPFSRSALEQPSDGISSNKELIQNIDNLLYLADYALSNNPLTPFIKGEGAFLAPALDEETVYVRGREDGSIETERHSKIKGAPLISVRLTHGNSDFSTSTITRTYDSEDDFTNGKMSSERNTTGAT